MCSQDANTDQVKKAYLANVRHELRTPIKAIVGYSELLIEDAEELEQVDLLCATSR